ncbi:hypothetical protein HK105_200549 [Polyrhizophydium stewartii]|uniref:Reverse transcriptase zinc-binding domain-containing protein n=1 Tax=Polyrhizophydium stewartii TaxID=2732419 RepID=A0ABR4NJI9_9FUNG
MVSRSRLFLRTRILVFLIDDCLTLGPWLRHKKLAILAAASLRPFLHNSTIPLSARLQVFSSAVLGVAGYCLELIGGNRSRLAPLQTPINRALRELLKLPRHTPVAAMLAELSLDSIDTLAIRARIRLFRKANSLATPLKALIAPRNIFFSRRLVWSRGSARLHRRFVGLTWFPGDWAARELLPRLHERRMLVSPARATASYRDHQFAATAGFFRSPMFDASLSNGVRYLIAARCNAIWSTSRAVAARLLRNSHPFVGRQCPICRTPLGAFSPVGHLITACTDPRIQAYRDTIGFSREFFVLLWQHAHEVAGLLPAPDVNSLDLSILVLGRTLCGGQLGNDWLGGFSQMGTVRTMWSYSSSLWAYHRNAAARLLRNGHPFVGRQCPICRTPLGAFSPVGHLITACTDPRIQAHRDTTGFSREFFVLLWQHAHEVAGLLPAPNVNSLDLSILRSWRNTLWPGNFGQRLRTMWSYSSSLWAYHRNAAGQ